MTKKQKPKFCRRCLLGGVWCFGFWVCFLDLLFVFVFLSLFVSVLVLWGFFGGLVGDAVAVFVFVWAGCAFVFPVAGSDAVFVFFLVLFLGGHGSMIGFGWLGLYFLWWIEKKEGCLVADCLPGVWRFGWRMFA